MFDYFETSMTLLFRPLFAAILLTATLLSAPGHAAGLSTEDSAKQVWQLLDYLAVDYGGAVADGKVKKPDEYKEMQEFAQAAEQQLAALPDRTEKSVLLQQAAALKAAIGDKAAPVDVAERARGLAGALLATYPDRKSTRLNSSHSS